VLTFEQFIRDTARKGEVVNFMFEESLFGLIGVLHRITEPLVVETLTRDVDLMIRRSDLERVKEIAAQHGFRFRHTAVVGMLLHGAPESAKNAVHLLFTGEKVRPAQATPNPPIRPEKKAIHGRDVFVIPLADLVQMKLSAYRDKDRVHIRAMEGAGLITAEVERGLPTDLQARLQHIRETE